jgi:hypothetical protein
VHNGDIVDNASHTAQWTVADKALSTLEKPSPDLLDGLPYGLAVGNHDESPNGTPGGTDNFNKYFGVARFDNRAYYGGHHGSTNDNAWITFSAGGLDFIVVSLQYDTNPDAAVLAWARAVFEQHPNAFGILNAHYILGGNAGFGAQGQAIYDELRGVRNVRLMTCGHIHGEARRTDTYQGHVIHSMLADYQGRDDGGTGWMRIWELSPANNEITVRTYSPSLDKFETDAISEFTLPVDLRGSGGAFKLAATVAPAASPVSVAVPGLEAGRTYEWYATVGDCAHLVASPLFRFTTKP